MEPTMHCPGCGTEAPVTQKFCRSCGFSLEKVPQLVAEQLSESEEIVPSKAEKLQKRQQEIDRWLFITGIGVIVLIVLSLLSCLLYLMLAGNLPLLPGMVLLTLLLSGLVAGSLGIYSERLKRTLSGSSSLKQKQLPPGEATSKLAIEALEQPFSVTERTTSLLDQNAGVDKRKTKE